MINSNFRLLYAKYNQLVISHGEFTEKQMSPFDDFLRSRDTASMYKPTCLIFHIYSTKLYTTCITHWGRVTHVCVGNLTIIGSDNGLSPGRRQAIIWTNAGILSIWPLATKFSEILAEIITFSFKKMYLKVSSAKWRPLCLGLNVINPFFCTFFCCILDLKIIPSTKNDIWF